MKIRDRAKPKLPPVEPGTYMAVLVYSVDIGEQLCEYKDKAKSYNNQVMLTFELVGETIEVDGKQEPRTLSRTFNIAASKKSGLRKFLEAWRGRQYSDEEFMELDINGFVGAGCQLQVVLNESGEYANVAAMLQLPKGMPAPQHTLPLVGYDMEPWSDEAFATLPEWIQERIKKSTQYQQLHTPTDKIDFPETTSNPNSTGHPPDIAQATSTANKGVNPI